MLVANDKAGMGRQDDALMKCVDVYPERDEGWVISHTFSGFLVFWFSGFLVYYLPGLGKIQGGLIFRSCSGRTPLDAMFFHLVVKCFS